MLGSKQLPITDLGVGQRGSKVPDYLGPLMQPNKRKIWLRIPDPCQFLFLLSQDFSCFLVILNYIETRFQKETLGCQMSVFTVNTLSRLVFESEYL